MLQMYPYYNTVEFERLFRAGQLPLGVPVGKVIEYMAKPGSILLLVRDSASWDVEAVLVDLPREDDRRVRVIYTLYTEIEELDVEYIRSHLKSNQFETAEVRTPATLKLAGDSPRWRIMRHRQQAVGVLRTVRMIKPQAVENHVKRLMACGDTAKVEIYLSYMVRKKHKDICTRLSKLGFGTKNYVYHIWPQ